MRPHAHAPTAVYATVPSELRLAGWETAGLDELLAEPLETDRSWPACAWARLAVASTGPVVVGSSHPRLETAGWFAAAPDADLDAARAHCWPALPALRSARWGVGSCAPRLVLVGERDPYDRLPLLALAGWWLLRALRRLGHDELALYLTNAQTPKGRTNPEALAKVHAAVERYAPTWVALGEVARRALRAAGIEGGVEAPHPGEARRFRERAGPEGYAVELLKAGVPFGPWFHYEAVASERSSGSLAPRGIGNPIPTAPPSTVLAERLGLPLDLWALAKKDRSNPSAGGRGRGPGPAGDDRAAAGRPRTARASRSSLVVEAAHQAFVSGRAPTVAAAAREAGASKAACDTASRIDGWEAERERYARRVAADALERTARQDAEVLSSMRRLSAHAAALSLTDVVKRLQLPIGDERRLEPSPQQAESLVRAHLALAEVGDPMGDSKRDGYRSRSPVEVADELLRTLKEQGFVGEDGRPPAPKPA